MDIATLNEVIDMLTDKLRSAQERFNLHPSHAEVEGKLMGIYEALKSVEGMLHEELDYREKTQ